MQSLSTAKLAIAAVVLGVLAGAGAVYVKGSPSGNDRTPPMNEVAAVSLQGATDAASCPATDDRVAALTPVATGAVAAMSPTETPVSLASLGFNGPDGEPMTLGDFDGKTLLVNLWATWCAPCREEMPDLAELQERLGDADFEVVTVNIDLGDEEKPRAFLEEIGVDNLALYRDASMDIFNDLKSQGLAFGLPVTLLIDENSCLMAAMNGPAAWAGDDAIKLVETAKGI